MTRLAASKIREKFSDALNRVAFQHERIVVERNGHDIAALVSVEDLALLERLEDQGDVDAARKALKRGVFVPFGELKKKHKLP